VMVAGVGFEPTTFRL